MISRPIFGNSVQGLLLIAQDIFNGVGKIANRTQ